MNRKSVNDEKKRARNREAQRKHRAKQAAEKKSKDMRIGRLEGFIQDGIGVMETILKQNSIPTLQDLLNDAKEIGSIKNNRETAGCDLISVGLYKRSSLSQNCCSASNEQYEQSICQIDKNWGWLEDINNINTTDATQAFYYPNNYSLSQLNNNELDFGQFITPYELNITWP